MKKVLEPRDQFVLMKILLFRKEREKKKKKVEALKEKRLDKKGDFSQFTGENS